MHATLNIPDNLIAEVKKISGEKSKTKAIIIALKEYISKKRIDYLLSLKGKIDIDYDWKKEEEAEISSQRDRDKLIEKSK